MNDLDSCVNRWIIVTEEGMRNFKFYAFKREVDARYCFDEGFDKLGAISRVLFNPLGSEECRAGANLLAFKSICQAFRQRCAATAEQFGNDREQFSIPNNSPRQ